MDSFSILSPLPRENTPCQHRNHLGSIIETHSIRAKVLLNSNRSKRGVEGMKILFNLIVVFFWPAPILGPPVNHISGIQNIKNSKSFRSYVPGAEDKDQMFILFFYATQWLIKQIFFKKIFCGSFCRWAGSLVSLLILIPMILIYVTTKKITVIYREKEMRKE